MELKDLCTPSPINHMNMNQKSNIKTISAKEDTPFIQEIELQEFNLIGGIGSVRLSSS
jgi:hypothetical protein